MLREGRSNSSYIYIHMHTHRYMSMQMYVYIVVFKNKLADLIFTFHFGGNSGDTCRFSVSLFSRLRLFSVVYCRPVLARAPLSLPARLSGRRTPGVGGGAVRVHPSRGFCLARGFGRLRLHGNRGRLGGRLGGAGPGGWSWPRPSEREEALKSPGRSFPCHRGDKTEKHY